MRMLFTTLLLIAVSFSLQAAHSPDSTEFLVKMKNGHGLMAAKSLMADEGATRVEDLGLGWFKVRSAPRAQKEVFLQALKTHPTVEYAQPNYPVRLLHDFRLKDRELREKLQIWVQDNAQLLTTNKGPQDNPDFPPAPLVGKLGKDPLNYLQWGMQDIGAPNAWTNDLHQKPVVVAVIDTGVDYTHEDLGANMWRNEGESGRDSQGRDKSSNGVDDDGNGFVDDLMGWDFAANDNKPFDLTKTGIGMILGGGNPGHGTHCAGNVGAVANNSRGIAGVSNHVRIMALRFLTENGSGTTEGAIKSIRYAVDNGARVLSNSWGSEGEDPSAGEQNQALRDAIAYAESKGVIFVAAAGNGHMAVGYDNDSDPKPAYPASYPHDVIVSVAALNIQGELGSFSNWGAQSVDLGAPGVRVFSTVPGNLYQDKIDIMLGPINVGKLIGLPDIHWDGTSMATPHVAGAAALYWSKHPQKTWREVKQALLDSVTKIPSMSGKSVSGGKLNVKGL